MARMVQYELARFLQAHRRGRCVVAQWFTVDIAAVEYTQTQLQLAVGEPLRIVHKHRPLNPEQHALGVRQEIVARSGRVNDEDFTTTIMKDLSRVGERRFECAFKACYRLYGKSAQSHMLTTMIRLYRSKIAYLMRAIV
jgi:hypothetical protein